MAKEYMEASLYCPGAINPARDTEARRCCMDATRYHPNPNNLPIPSPDVALSQEFIERYKELERRKFRYEIGGTDYLDELSALYESVRVPNCPITGAVCSIGEPITGRWVKQL